MARALRPVPCRSGATTYDLGDRLGTAAKQTNASAATTATRTYDAFGMLVASTGTPQGPFGFVGAQGYQEDADTGLKLLGSRYYDPSTGRFLTRDKAKIGSNWYAYADSVPTKKIDVTGRFSIVIKLPSGPDGLLKDGWTQDPFHGGPYRQPGGPGLYNPPRGDRSGDGMEWDGRDWHKWEKGEKIKTRRNHLEAGDEVEINVPEPAPGPEPGPAPDPGTTTKAIGAGLLIVCYVALVIATDGAAAPLAFAA